MKLSVSIVGEQINPFILCCCNRLFIPNYLIDHNKKHNYLCNSCTKLSEDLMYHFFDKPTNISHTHIIEITYYVVETSLNLNSNLNEHYVSKHHYYLPNNYSNNMIRLYRKFDDVCQYKQSITRYTIISANIIPGFVILMNHGKALSTIKVTDVNKIRELEQIDLCK